VLREIEREPAPAAADVEHARPRRESQLGGEVTLLGELGVVERGRGRLEIAAAVLAVGVEKQRIELLVEIIVMRDVALGAAAQIELLEPPPDEPRPVERMGPAQRVAVARPHRHREQVGDRALLDHEGAVHVGFAELELGLEQNADLGAPAGEACRHHRPVSVAECENFSSCGRQAQVATPDQTRDQHSQQPIHGAHPQRHGRLRSAGIRQWV
jgi:hypothetical protein